ncbi:MAG: hypothetical protein KatS3mg105_0897 [Gemmatales bacterium]|nr:MAG: hypothetical protein KatS3mg105_0897 [Gemmatales bacterium]
MWDLCSVDELRGWLAHQLGVPENATPDQVRRGFCHRLQEEHFIPPQNWQDAQAWLCGEISAAAKNRFYSRLFLERQLALEQCIEEFAQAFFQLDPAERELRYRNLERLCSNHPKLAARLRRLQRGLKIRSGLPLAENDLLKNICDLFVASPAKAATQRQCVLNDWQKRRDRRAAVRSVRTSFPEVADLVPGFLDEVLGKRLKVRLPAAAKGAKQLPSSFSLWLIFSAVVVGLGLGVVTVSWQSKTWRKVNRIIPNEWQYQPPILKVPNVGVDDSNVKDAYYDQFLQELERKSIFKSQQGANDQPQDPVGGKPRIENDLQLKTRPLPPSQP